MKVMFFRCLIAYYICASITLYFFITDRLHINKDGKEHKSTILMILFSLDWPYTMYLTYKWWRNNNDKDK